MIQKHYSLRHADKILNKLFEILGRCEDGTPDIVVECWANCREQGYILKQWDRPCVCFAQARNGDETIILWGPSNLFDITTNMPHNDLWKNTNYLESDDDKAVAFIIDKLGIIEAQLVGKTFGHVVV